VKWKECKKEAGVAYFIALLRDAFYLSDPAIIINAMVALGTTICQFSLLCLGNWLRDVVVKKYGIA
jgi:hypothetical protein